MYWLLISLFMLVGQSAYADVSYSDLMFTFKELENLDEALQNQKKDPTFDQRQSFGIRYSTLTDNLQKVVPQLKSNIDSLRKNLKKFNIIPIKSVSAPADYPGAPVHLGPLPKTPLEMVEIEEMELERNINSLDCDILSNKRDMKELKKKTKGLKARLATDDSSEEVKNFAQRGYEIFKEELEDLKEDTKNIKELKNELEDDLDKLQKRRVELVKKSLL